MKQLYFFLFCILFPQYLSAQNLQWSTTEGPYSTTVNTFSSMSSTMLFAGTKAGLYQSTNGGDIWTAVPSVPGLVNDIAVKDKNIYVGGTGGCTISLDSGVTWAIKDSGFTLFPLVYSLKNINDTLYACLGSDGLYRSADTGRYWEHLNSGGIENKSVFTMISTGSSFLVAEGSGILRSTDNGFSWIESDGDIANQGVHTFAINGAIIFAGTDLGVYRSTDDGATWNRSSTGMNSTDAISSLTVSGSTIFAGTSDFNIDFNSTSGIYRSTDNGASWQLVNTGLSNLSLYSLFSIGNRIFAGTFLGISHSDNNGDLWKIASNGLPKPSVVSLTSLYNYSVFAGSTGNYIFESNDQGDHWGISKKGLTRPNVNAMLGTGTTLFAGTDATPKDVKGGIHRSTDNGNTWTQLNSGIPIFSITSLTNIGTKIYASGDRGVVSSSDAGTSWSQVNSGLTDTIVKALSAFKSDLFAGTQSGIFKDLADLGNWTSIIENIGLTNVHINALTSTSSYLYAGTDSGVYRQNTDSIFSWSLVSPDSLFVQSLWSNEFLMLAGTKTGIYASSDNAKTWVFQQSAGIVSVNTFTTANRNIYAGTSAGIIKTALGQYGVKSSSPENPLSLQVTNPSAASAIIRYSLKERGDASLFLYDIIGNECAKLFQDIREVGEYNMNWNTSLLPTGMYILRLNAGGNQTSVIMSVIH